MNYTLMNKNTLVISFRTEKTETGMTVVKELVIRTPEMLPIGFEEGDRIKDFINRRRAPKHRKHIAKLRRQLHADNIEGYIRVTNGATLTDTFWIRNEESPLSWKEVSLYQNEFDENIARIAIDGGNASMSGTSPELSVNGQYAKCWIREDGELYLLKRGEDMFGQREVCAEFYAAQIAKALCPDAVHYDIVMHHDLPASKCHIFTSEQTGFVPITNLYRSQRGTEAADLLYEVSKYDDGNSYRRMVVVDALTLNIDRHLGNFGFLIDNDTMKPLKMAPVFDFNRSMMFNLTHDQFMREDMENPFAEPCTSGDFVGNAKMMLTDEIWSDLKNLRGFQFERSDIDNWPEERLKKYEQFIEQQIGKILS